MIGEPAPPAAPARPAAALAAGDGVAAAADGVTIRRVATPAEYRACVVLQREIWGADFAEFVSATVLLLAQQLGGVVAGAFAADGALLGFVFGLSGTLEGRPVHWSDLLTVRPGARGARVGERLKRYQRALARATGAEAMYWTFDPLVARNAHLNLARLGARVVAYVPDMYGAATGSPLHGGLPTDRLVARWDLGPGDGVAGNGVAGAGAPVVNPVAADGTPALAAPAPDGPRVRLVVPRDVDALPPALHAAWRAAVRAAFGAALGRGYRVTGFRRAATNGAASDELPYYELERVAPSSGAARPALAESSWSDSSWSASSWPVPSWPAPSPPARIR